jgi:hypothetical protein
MQFLEKNNIKDRLANLLEQHQLQAEAVEIISARVLTPQEAIGRPERQDFPLFKGKEFMVQATFKGSLGQAFTDMPGNFKGTLQEVVSLPLQDNFQRAIFISSLNAVLRHLKLVEKTVHCRDKEPGQCAKHLVEYIRERFGSPRIAFIGLQPAMVESLSKNFNLRVTDLDSDNVGKIKCGVMIEDPRHTEDIVKWSDLVLATGTTVVNDTAQTILREKPVIFYGVTIAGIAFLQGYEQYCFCGH